MVQQVGRRVNVVPHSLIIIIACLVDVLLQQESCRSSSAILKSHSSSSVSHKTGYCIDAF